MISVLLTHSYFLHFDPKQEQAHMPYPPLGTLYAAAVLRQQGIRLSFFDTMLRTAENEVASALTETQPDVLVIYDDDFHYLNKMCLSRMRDAAMAMTRIAAAMGIPVIVHGSDAVDHADLYLASGATAVIFGEGEQTLLELCRSYEKNGEGFRTDIPGTVIERDGKIHRNAKRPVVHELDSLPIPAWDLVEWSRYRSVWKKHHRSFSVNMVTTRGCPYHCNWCAKPIYGQVYHTRSPEKVVEEMLLLQQTVRPDHLWFADDIFGLTPGWVERFSAEVQRSGAAIPYKIQSRADLLLNGSTVKHLAASGCTEVWIGAESGSQKILDAMEKGITLRQITDARLLLQKHGIRAAFFLQFGYRGETLEDINATVSMVRTLMPDDIGISISYPLPGTPFFDMVKSEMGEKTNWKDSDDLAMMYRGTFSPRFYKRLHRYVHQRFRFRQGVMMLRDLFSMRGTFNRETIRRILLLAYYLPAIPFNRVRLLILSRFP